MTKEPKLFIASKYFDHKKANKMLKEIHKLLAELDKHISGKSRMDA